MAIAFNRGLRASIGPTAFATGRGNRRHIAISARYFGFSGLFCGTSARLQQAVLVVRAAAGSKPQFFLNAYEPVPRLLRP